MCRSINSSPCITFYLQKRQSPKSKLFDIGNHPLKNSNIPLQHVEFFLFDIYQSHSSKKLFQFKFSKKQNLVDNSRIQNTENKKQKRNENIKTNEVTFNHFYWSRRIFSLHFFFIFSFYVASLEAILF